MKKGDIVKASEAGLWMFHDYGIGLVLGTDGLGGLKVYWPSQKFWCITTTKNVVRI